MPVSQSPVPEEMTTNAATTQSVMEMVYVLLLLHPVPTSESPVPEEMTTNAATTQSVMEILVYVFKRIWGY